MRIPLLAALALSRVITQGAAQVPDVAASDPRPTRLFASVEPISIRLEADFRAVFRNRDTTRTDWHPARLAWRAADDSGAMDVQIATRGHFRLRPGICSFPPLRIQFPAEQRRGTIWRGQGTLKLATHCRTGNRRYEQIVHQEFLVYRMYNALTDTSYRVRFVHATYVDRRPGQAPVEAPAFFIEDVDDLASRIGAREFERPGVPPGVGFEDLQPGPLALLSVFMYMVGATDWSVPYLHNIRILASPEWEYVAVPYDFDWTGFVNAPYARPDPRLGIRTVEERVWRGPCLSPADLAHALDRIEAAREAILALVRDHPGLDPRLAQQGVRYLEEFYREAAELRRRRPTLEGTCGFRR
jgi:hypothetical protein